MKWSAFRAHAADFFDQAANADTPARRSFRGGEPPRHPPPSLDELRDTPFEGDIDPLEELFNR